MGNRKSKSLLAKLENGVSMSTKEFRKALLCEGLSFTRGKGGKYFIVTYEGNYLTDSHGNRLSLPDSSKGGPTKAVYNAVKGYLNNYQP